MDAKSYVVVTSMGTDRPGIVEDISGWILEQGGNIENSRMSRLGGEFATLILVSGGAELHSKLSASSESFSSKYKLAVFTKPVSGTPPMPETTVLRYQLRATSLDHPGILHLAAQLLRQQSISIVSASTQTSPAPFTGAPVFQFHMELDIPASVTIAQLRTQLEELGSRDNIDFILAPAKEA